MSYGRSMAEETTDQDAAVTVLHNPRCSTSRAALEKLQSAGVEAEVIDYLKAPLDAPALRTIIGALEDPVGDLVRRDDLFTELELTDADVATEEQVLQLLLEHPRLMQRPVLVKDGRAIIGRPKERVDAFLAE